MTLILQMFTTSTAKRTARLLVPGIILILIAWWIVCSDGCERGARLLTLAEARDYNRSTDEILVEELGSVGPYRPTRQIKGKPGGEIRFRVLIGPASVGSVKGSVPPSKLLRIYGPDQGVAYRAQLFETPGGYGFAIVNRRLVE